MIDERAGEIDALGFAGRALSHSGAKLRLAVVGTGVRFTRAWGTQLLKEQSDRVEIVGMCDINPKRLAASKRVVGIDAPTFTDLGEMLRRTRPDALVVTTKDSTHDDMIVQALEAGFDVITEKPMTTDETNVVVSSKPSAKAGSGLR